MMMKFVTVSCLFLAMLLLSSCDAHLRDGRLEFVQFPNRIVYIANVDTELDLTGATIVIMVGEEDYSSEISIPDRWHVVEHSIDFTTPGIYQVEIVRTTFPQIRLPFFVQVIDEEVFNQLVGLR